MPKIYNNKHMFTIPFGPRVVFTKSAMAIAPTNDAYNTQTKIKYCHHRNDKIKPFKR